MLLDKYPWLKDKPKTLAHYNPYSITEGNWDEFDHVIADNRTINTNLKKIMHNPAERLTYIPITVDTDFWTFNPDWEPNKNVIMVANRIEAKKGILPVAKACRELGLKFILVGAISDRNYFMEVMKEGAVFHDQVSDEQLKELYYSSTIHVCNSIDNFESGTMPVLESMLCGVPVLTRRVGHVPDFENEENLVIQDSDPEDVSRITYLLEQMINDKKKLESMRQPAWNSAKNFSDERRAYMWQQVYRKVSNPAVPVSVIIPINDNHDVVRKCLTAIAEQDYPNLELVICDDGGIGESFIPEFAKTVSLPVRLIETIQSDGDGGYDYGLARARNEGIIAATGDILVFCDQRMIMQPNAITELVKNLVPKTWVYGDKGTKKDFVENFSAVYRQELINAGMFCERITKYGGMSQEIRARTKAQGIKHVYTPDAKATPLGKSSNRWRKKADIIESKNRLFKMNLQ